MNIMETGRLVIVGLATAWLLGPAYVRAQSQDNARERMFAELLLSRRAHASATQTVRRGAARPAVRKAETEKPTRSTIDRTQSPLSPRNLAVRATRAPTGPTLGLEAATPTVPSKYGASRDAFVESLYPDILGSNPTQRELDFLARALARGESTESIARALWNSPEHRKLVREHKAPNISFAAAYRKAIAASRRAKHK